MRKYLALITAIFFAGCQSAIDPDEYYVKYTLDSYHIQIGHEIELLVTHEDGEQQQHIIAAREYVEITIGPVPAGFNAKLFARDYEGNNSFQLDASILVSKNNGPFALKEFDHSSEYRQSVALDYTIDF